MGNKTQLAGGDDFVRTAVDLFAGAGGATQGLKDAGYNVIAAVENDSAAATSFGLNHPETGLFTADIRTLDSNDVRSFLQESGQFTSRLDLLNACPPCQGFSSRGARNKGDERNELLLQVPIWIESFRPRALILENVPGVATDVRFRQLTDLLAASDYGQRSYVIDASDYGVPQRRRRLFHLAVHGIAEEQLPVELADCLPDHINIERQTSGDWLAIADAQKERDPLHRSRTLQPRTLERVRAVPIAGSRFDLPEHLQLACHKRLDARTGGRRAVEAYGRVKADDVAPTMTTRCTTVSCGRFIHPTKNRGLTLREASLLQTFPPDYQLSGTYGEIERQIGNAVPPRLITVIAECMKALLVSTPA